MSPPKAGREHPFLLVVYTCNESACPSHIDRCADTKHSYSRFYMLCLGREASFSQHCISKYSIFGLFYPSIYALGICLEVGLIIYGCCRRVHHVCCDTVLASL